MRRRALFSALALAALAIAAAIFNLWLQNDDATRIWRERQRRLAEYARATGPSSGGAGEAVRPQLSERLAVAGFAAGSPVFIRIFKLEFELEVWLHRNGRFELFEIYPICRWSGGLGPKIREGDRQAPEGFYTIASAQLNPSSRWHRSFNLGFPNLYDRALGRTGSFLMIHGGCSSVGCYAMTDPQIDELWRLVTAALAAGQPRVHVHVFPFRLTGEALDRRRGHPAESFWRGLEPGYRLFETTHLVPQVGVCRGRYTFRASAGPLAAPLTEACSGSELLKEARDALPVPGGATGSANGSARSPE